MTKRTGKREAARLARVFQDRQIIADLRKHFTGYDPKDGFSLTPEKISELPYSKRRGIRAKHEKLQALLKLPFVDFVKTEDDASRKAVKQYLEQTRHATGANMRNMKHFIVPKPSAESTITVKGGKVQVKTEFPGEVAHVEKFFMFPRTPSGPGDLIKMFDRLYKTMPEGNYDILSNKYDAIMYPVDRGQLRDEVLRLLETYDNPKYGEDRFLYVLTGFRFTAMSIKGAMQQAKQRHDVRARQREFNRKQSEKINAEIKKATKRCPVIVDGQRCVKKVDHKGPHKIERK